MHKNRKQRVARVLDAFAKAAGVEIGFYPVNAKNGGIPKVCARDCIFPMYATKDREDYKWIWTREDLYEAVLKHQEVVWAEQLPLTRNPLVKTLVPKAKSIEELLVKADLVDGGQGWQGKKHLEWLR